MISDKIEQLHAELLLYCAIYEDFNLSKMSMINAKTDFVYREFCRRHPEVKVNQQRFTRILCKEFGLKVVRSRLDGERGYFYERSEMA